MTCKDCVHYEVCLDDASACGVDFVVPTENCKHFKPKSRFVELPCEVGQKVAVRACCECVSVIYDNDECRRICPFEDDCECEECDNGNQRMFETTISRIYNEGFGWKVNFKNLSIIEASIKDIGISFFVGENAREQAEEYEKALSERSK